MSSQQKLPGKSFWTPTRIGLVVSVIVVVVLVVSALYQPNKSPQTDPFSSESQANTGESSRTSKNPGTTEAGGVLPESVLQSSFKTIDGKSRKLADYSGKILIVNLWATWCQPCRQEIPHLIEIADEYKGKGVEVIGLSTDDPNTDTQLVKEFTRQFKINYPIAMGDPRLLAALMGDRDGIPQAIVIGRDGRVKKHFVGFNPVISPPQLKAILDEALASG